MGNEELCGAPRLKAIKLIIFILFPVGLILLMLALIIFFLQRRKRHSKQKIDQENSIVFAKRRRISYQELHQATNGFAQHSPRNLVKIISSCCNVDFKALEYLHHGQPILEAHCDLKPINFLLDEDMVAHLGDLDIAKLLGDEEDSTIQTITLATIG
ncbi:hypothetical protein QQP08_021413, partial [Theobroma cacao]